MMTLFRSFAVLPKSVGSVLKCPDAHPVGCDVITSCWADVGRRLKSEKMLNKHNIRLDARASLSVFGIPVASVAGMDLRNALKLVQ